MPSVRERLYTGLRAALSLAVLVAFALVESAGRRWMP